MLSYLSRTDFSRRILHNSTKNMFSSAMLFAVVPVSQLNAFQHPSTYAGYNVPENSPINVGMSQNARSNSYWYPSAPENDGWKYAVYDLPGSYAEPVVDAYHPVNDFSGIGAQFLYPPYSK